MDTNVNYTIVGAFVIVLLTAVVLSILWLSSGLSNEHYSTYIVYMQESVSGLNVDAPIEYNGVNVGSVKRIMLNEKNPHLVELLLNIKTGTPITQGTVATLKLRGLTGVSYLALRDNGKNLAPLVTTPGQHHPVIKTEPSFFLQLDAALTRLDVNMGQITKSLQSVLDAENQRSIKEILLNMSQFAAVLADNSEKLTTILENTARSSRQLTPLLQASAGTMQVLTTQTLPATNRMINNLDEATRNLLTISAQIKQNPAILIRGKQLQPLGPGEK